MNMMWKEINDFWGNMFSFTSYKGMMEDIGEFESYAEVCEISMIADDHGYHTLARRIQRENNYLEL